MACDGSADLSGFKKRVTCGGRRYDEFSNFYGCMIWAEDDYWRSSEHYYQALKFPGKAGSAIREAIRDTSSPMESWQLGNSSKALLRKDWEEVKINMMYQANLLKFSQAEHLRTLIVDSNGPIVCDGGLFWKTWNEIVLERIREELRDNDTKNQSELKIRVALMQAYSFAAASGDQRALEAVTHWAAKRQLPPQPSDTDSVTVSGLVGGQAMVLRPDLLQPEVNGQPHFVSGEGWHLYVGAKRGRLSWVLDEICTENETTGHAFLELSSDRINMPCGSQQWHVWDDALNKHVIGELALSTY